MDLMKFSKQILQTNIWELHINKYETKLCTRKIKIKIINLPNIGQVI